MSRYEAKIYIANIKKSTSHHVNVIYGYCEEVDSYYISFLFENQVEMVGNAGKHFYPRLSKSAEFMNWLITIDAPMAKTLLVTNKEPI